MKQLIAVATAVALAGCSFVFVHGPDPDAAKLPVYPECTGQKTWPIIDAVLAGVYLAASFTAISRDGDPPMTGPDATESKLSPRAAAAVSLGVAALAGAGAFVGFRRVASCRKARGEFRIAYPQGVPYQQPMPQPPPQPQYYPSNYGPSPGTEGGACMANNWCSEGLVCGSGLCVRLAPAPAPAQPGGAP